MSNYKYYYENLYLFMNKYKERKPSTENRSPHIVSILQHLPT